MGVHDNSFSRFTFGFDEWASSFVGTRIVIGPATVALCTLLYVCMYLMFGKWQIAQKDQTGAKIE